MAERADAGRSGKKVGREARATKGAGGSRDIGESSGQMKQKRAANSPQVKADEVAASLRGNDTTEGRHAPRQKKP
jgi:hypothetical protein